MHPGVVLSELNTVPKERGHSAVAVAVAVAVAAVLNRHERRTRI